MARLVSEPQARIAEIDAEQIELERQLLVFKPQLVDLVATYAVKNDFEPAKELGQRIRSIEEHLAELAAERIASISTEEKRVADARAKEARAVPRICRAKYGEWRRARQDRDDALANAERYHRRAIDAVSAIRATLPDEIEWPIAYWYWEGEFALPSPDERIVARVTELDRFFETTFAALAAALPNADTAGEPIAK